MPEKKKHLPLYFKLLTAITSIVLFVAVAEITLKVLDPELAYKNQFFPVNRDIDFPEFYKKDPNLFWRLRENQTIESKWFSHLSYHVNSNGMRGPEFQKKKDGIRILALGNSCTFGWAVPYEQSWPYLLQEKLNEELPERKIEVINAGIPGYSSYQGKIFLEDELLSLQPDILLLMFGWNDHWRAGKGISDAEQQMPGQIVLGLQNMLSKLRLYKLLRKVTLSASEDTQFVRLDDLSGKRRVSQDEYFDNLTEMIKTARSHDIVPILLVPPIASLANYFEGTQSNLHLLHHRYQQQMIRAAKYSRTDFVDLQQIFDNYDNLYDRAREDPVHFNVRGHQVLAGAIIDKVTTVIENRAP